MTARGIASPTNVKADITTKVASSDIATEGENIPEVLSLSAGFPIIDLGNTGAVSFHHSRYFVTEVTVEREAEGVPIWLVSAMCHINP